ncbi:hypothetical protein CEXT_768621 [Caerostris extrusa]|uniref:Uncharacterized protein n=1 Tax=Caerostris extrusa TaxID=172846 RepID=A0AAV4RHG6_CAEEX|nr:hypothetical protein CEXT_768621 [Caerostris extrusa]
MNHFKSAVGETAMDMFCSFHHTNGSSLTCVPLRDNLVLFCCLFGYLKDTAHMGNVITIVVKHRIETVDPLGGMDKGLSHLRNISSTLIVLRSSFHVEINTTSLAYGSSRLHSGSKNSATSPIMRTHSSALQLIIMRLDGKKNEFAKGLLVLM